jgi:hypothetical protein
MASSLHLDLKDLEKLANVCYGAQVTQQDGDVIVSWPQRNISVSLRSLKLSGAFMFNKLSVEVQNVELKESGVDFKFSAK